MDKTDMEILSHLADDGKAKIRAIAKKAGLPMSTVHHRIGKMEREGVIRKYSAVPDYRKIGLPVCAYVLVNVEYSGIRSQEAVAREIRRLPNVLETNIISGEIDIIAKVRAGSIDELGETVIKRLRNIKGVAKTVTSVVMKEME
jgi:Lrp/AsnC family transcriptional regulator for asnA, asnC and gidA